MSSLYQVYTLKPTCNYQLSKMAPPPVSNVSNTNTNTQVEPEPNASTNTQARKPAHISLTPFSKTDPSTFFTIAQLNFEAHAIHDDRYKILTVISYLPDSLLPDVIDTAKDVNCTFDAFKKRVIEVAAAPSSQRLNSLLNVDSIGSKTPSQFLRQLRTLACPETDPNAKILEALWLNQLPERVRLALVPFGKTP